jgi:hypothetical protein
VIEEKRFRRLGDVPTGRSMYASLPTPMISIYLFKKTSSAGTSISESARFRSEFRRCGSLPPIWGVAISVWRWRWRERSRNILAWQSQRNA